MKKHILNIILFSILLIFCSCTSYENAQVNEEQLKKDNSSLEFLQLQSDYYFQYILDPSKVNKDEWFINFENRDILIDSTNNLLEVKP